MKKLDIIFKTLISLTIVIFITSCEIDSFAESDEHSFGDIVAPSNVQVTADIKGQDADNPNGRWKNKRCISSPWRLFRPGDLYPA